MQRWNSLFRVERVEEISRILDCGDGESLTNFLGIVIFLSIVKSQKRIKPSIGRCAIPVTITKMPSENKAGSRMIRLRDTS